MVKRFLTVLCAALFAACGNAGSLSPTTKAPLAPSNAAPGQGILYRFKGDQHRDGQYPDGGLVAVNGTFYGTTAQGGNPNGCKCGTVYRMNAAGKERVLHRFKGAPDGANPSGSLLAFDGELYGTTVNGGADNAGAVFSIDPSSGAERIVCSFKGPDEGDGAKPAAGLIVLDAVLYGATSQGGSTICSGSSDCGVIFSLTTSGSERILYAFKGGYEDGGNPIAGLTAMHGRLYGTTSGGGLDAQTCYAGCGTVFTIGPAGGGYKVLYRFKGGDDGVIPNASLVTSNGKLYGTTSGGGGAVCVATGFGCGVVFEVGAFGKERVVHRFTHGIGGSAPNGLIVAGGVLYGTTEAGGSGECEGYGCGSVFRLSTSGEYYAVLRSFLGSSDGSEPSGTLLDANGTLYGVTEFGGRCLQRCYDSGFGTVFSVTL